VTILLCQKVGGPLLQAFIAGTLKMMSQSIMKYFFASCLSGQYEQTTSYIWSQRHLIDLFINRKRHRRTTNKDV
jgi:hypothetical protein